ncbi:MAG: hypothetical protein NT069_13550 [Planctomycetota bacterium]|nr:hypothetical protein [Planctomycetota bacterium]
MMREIKPGVESQDDATTESERQKAMREVWLQTANSLVITLAAICVPIALSLSLPFEWAISGRASSLGTAFGIGSIVAVAAAFGIFRNAPTYLASLSADCKSGNCERLSVSAHRAVAFETSVTTPAIAIGCGDRTLIVFGGWWTNRSRRPDITWKSEEPHAEFPAKRFVIRRLTRTGRVLSVQIEGDRLPVERWIDPQTMNLPTLNADFPLSVDAILLEHPLDFLLRRLVVSHSWQFLFIHIGSATTMLTKLDIEDCLRNAGAECQTFEDGRLHVRMSGSLVSHAALQLLSGRDDITDVEIQSVGDGGDQLVEQISRVVGLKSLSLLDVDINPEQLGVLSRLRNLEILRWTGKSSLADRTQGISQIHSLRALWLDHSGILQRLYLGQNAVHSGLVVLTDLVSLREVSLTHTNAGDDTMVALSGLPGLERLFLDGCRISERGLVVLANCPRLVYLVIGGAEVTGPGIQALATRGVLKEFVLSAPGISDDILDSLAEFTSLDRLTIRNSNLSINSAFRLRRALPDCDLSIEPDGWSISDPQCAELVAYLQKMGNEVTVTDQGFIRNVAPDAEVADEFCVRFGATWGVQELCFNGGLSTRGLRALAGSETLRELWLRRGDVGLDLDSDSLEVLATFPRLARLVITLPWPLEVSLRHIAECRRLTRLEIEHSGPIDAASGLLGGCTSVECLRIGPDVPWRRGLSVLLQLPRLRELTLWGTETAPDELEWVRHHPTLKELDLSDLQISPADWLAISQSRPLRMISLNRIALSANSFLALRGISRLEHLTIVNQRVAPN